MQGLAGDQWGTLDIYFQGAIKRDCLCTKGAAARVKEAAGPSQIGPCFLARPLLVRHPIHSHHTNFGGTER